MMTVKIIIMIQFILFNRIFALYHHNHYNYRQYLFSSPRDLSTVTKDNFISNLKRMISSLIGISLVSKSSILIADDDVLDNDSIIRQRKLPLKELKERIQSAKVFSFEQFLTEDEANLLRKEIEAIEQSGLFKYSGLTNRANLKQEFGKNDRQIYPIAFNDDNNNLNTFNDNILKKLRKELAIVLDRPSLCNDESQHECYFSKSSIGASLPLHLDERHEEVKGRKGWLSPSRRSISWLIYLSDDGWSDENGGELRSYPQIPNVASNVGSDDGNLQIGWLKPIPDTVYPVFLDISRTNYFDFSGMKLSALYIRQGDNRRYITKNFDIIDSNTGSARTNFDKFFFDDSNQFYRIEEIEKWVTGNTPTGSKVEDFLPKKGTLVLFDSVSLPHEVMATMKGQRLALAGWFHEDLYQII